MSTNSGKYKRVSFQQTDGGTGASRAAEIAAGCPNVAISNDVGDGEQEED